MDERNVGMNIHVKYLLIFLFLILALIGIVGNVLVIISVRIDSRMKRSLTNRLIVHVACCDLLILLFNLPDLIQFVLSKNGNWLLNELSCKLIRSILVLAQYTSVLTMCVVTIERFIGIVYPLRSKLLDEKEHVTRITFILCFFSLICASPNLFYLHVMRISSTRRSCLLQYSKDLSKHQQIYIIYKSIESTIFYFLPLLIQLYSYIRIAIQLVHVDQTLHTSIVLTEKSNHQRTLNEIDDEDYYIENDHNTPSRLLMTEFPFNSSNGQINSRRSQSSYSTNLQVNPNSPRIHFRSHEDLNNSHRSFPTSNALKSRRSVIKMLIVVVLIYFISFSPQVLVFVLFDTNRIEPVPQFIQTPYFIAFTMLLVTISSASNPVVYAIFCSKFRQSFVKLLRRLCLCRQPRFTSHTNQRTMQQRTYHFTGKIKKKISSENIDNDRQRT